MALDGKELRSCDGDDDPCFQAFVTEMELKDKVKRDKTEEQSALKRLQRFSKQKQWRQQVRRTQQYLGLSTARTPGAGSIETICSDLEGLKVTGRVLEEDPGRAIHYNLKPFPYDSDTFVMFISVDVEAFEFNQKNITEIGISTLNTVDLLGLDSGANGKNWAAEIRSRHFRIREYGHLLNKVHVEGCPDKFDFGQSEWIYKRDVISVLEGCFNPFRPSCSSGTGKVILVGHDVAADIKYLTEIGFDAARMISDCIDTSDLYKASRRDGKQSALSTLLLQYGIAAKHLHNAGNDANYTLRVMVAIALDDSQHQKSAEEWEVEKGNRIEAACKVAAVKVCADFEGWSTSEDEDVTNSSTLSLAIDQRQRKKAPGIAEGRYKSDTKSIMENANQKRQVRQKYLTHIDGTLGDVAVQDNPNFQDVLQRPFVPLYMASPEEQLDERGGRGNDGHGRGHGRSRGRNRVHGQGRGLVQKSNPPGQGIHPY